jgi:rRNA maturation endonuclease Nob1
VKAYYIRGIDDDVWARAKARAKAEGRNMQYVLSELLRTYGGVKILKCHGCGAIVTLTNGHAHICPTCHGTQLELMETYAS